MGMVPSGATTLPPQMPGRSRHRLRPWAGPGIPGPIAIGSPSPSPRSAVLHDTENSSVDEAELLQREISESSRHYTPSATTRSRGVFSRLGVELEVIKIDGMLQVHGDAAPAHR